MEALSHAVNNSPGAGVAHSPLKRVDTNQRLSAKIDPTPVRQGASERPDRDASTPAANTQLPTSEAALLALLNTKLGKETVNSHKGSGDVTTLTNELLGETAVILARTNDVLGDCRAKVSQDIDDGVPEEDVEFCLTEMNNAAAAATPAADDVTCVPLPYPIMMSSVEEANNNAAVSTGANDAAAISGIVVTSPVQDWLQDMVKEAMHFKDDPQVQNLMSEVTRAVDSIVAACRKGLVEEQIVARTLHQALVRPLRGKTTYETKRVADEALLTALANEREEVEKEFGSQAEDALKQSGTAASKDRQLRKLFAQNQRKAFLSFYSSAMDRLTAALNDAEEKDGAPTASSDDADKAEGTSSLKSLMSDVNTQLFDLKKERDVRKKQHNVMKQYKFDDQLESLGYADRDTMQRAVGVAQTQFEQSHHDARRLLKQAVEAVMTTTRRAVEVKEARAALTQREAVVETLEAKRAEQAEEIAARVRLVAQSIGAWRDVKDTVKDFRSRIADLTAEVEQSAQVRYNKLRHCQEHVAEGFERELAKVVASKQRMLEELEREEATLKEERERLEAYEGEDYATERLIVVDKRTGELSAHKDAVRADLGVAEGKLAEVRAILCRANDVDIEAKEEEAEVQPKRRKVKGEKRTRGVDAEQDDDVQQSGKAGNDDELRRKRKEKLRRMKQQLKQQQEQ